MIMLTFISCVFWGEEREKTFTARQISDENVFSYGSVYVKVNPELGYTNISGNIKVEIMGELSKPTKREFHIFARPGIDKLVLIETHTRTQPHTFDPHRDITKKMSTIQKGKKPVDGRTWDVYVRSHPQFPEQILDAVRQKGILMKRYRCGLEIGAARVINRYNRIYVSYIKGFEECREVPQNNSVLSNDQIRLIREFANEFEENITISDQSSLE